MDEISTTNILGHLNWWYGAVARGLGKSEEEINQVMGSTDQVRSFRFRVSGGYSPFTSSIKNKKQKKGWLVFTGRKLSEWKRKSY